MIILNIEGRNLPRLDIIEYKPVHLLLDGEATARTRAPGWKMIREPQGVITNFEIVIASTRTDNPDYVYFMEQFYSLGARDFLTVRHTDHVGRQWTQQMYYVVEGVEVIKFESNFLYTGNINASFIGREGEVRA